MNRTPSGPNPQILEEAAAWFVTLRGQTLATADAREFHDWLKRSPEHIRAYLEIAAVYADIPAPEHGHTSADLIAMARTSVDQNVIPLNLDALVSNGPSTKVRRSVGTRMTLAASMLICIGLGAWLHFERNTYKTSIGEQRSITLDDGSIVELNAHSKVRIAFGDRQRDVELLEGQALFRVAKDHARPFVVHAGTASVRAVGTQFDVNRRRMSTTVTVLEGRVAVASGEGAMTPRVAPDVPASMETLLVSGEQMTVTPTEASKSDTPNLAAATAWTQHLLIFDGTALHDVLEEFSRHTTRRITIDSPELAALKISGQYTSTNPDSLLRFLSLQEGVIVSDVNGEIHIRKE
ncbi:MAG TPA: FecR family protein [Steroidobacter sp.]